MSDQILYARRSDRFDFQATYKVAGSPQNLTGYTSEMIFSWPAYRDLVIPPVDAGSITLTMDALGSNGVIGAHLNDVQTLELPASGVGRNGPVVSWQLRIAIGGENTTLASGSVDVAPSLFDAVT